LYNVVLKIFDESINSSATYEVTRPRIIDFNPKEATYNDIITILVENFSDDLRVTLNNGNDGPLEIVSKTSSEIKVRLSDYIPLTSNTIVVNNIVANDLLVLKKPEITYYQELSGKRDQNLIIEGKYISPNSYCYDVSIGGTHAFVENITSTSFEIRIPFIPVGTYSINLKIADYQYIITDRYTLFDTWSLYSEKPDNISSGLNYPGYFIIGSKVYIVTGTRDAAQTQDACSFDLSSKTWQNLPAFPGMKRIFAVGWAFNATGYIGLGYSNDTGSGVTDFYKYNATSNTWTELANAFPGEGRRQCFGVATNNLAYVGGGWNMNVGRNFDFYEFNPNGEIWTRKADIPYHSDDIRAVTLKNTIYAQSGKSLFKFNSMTNSWTTEIIPNEISSNIYPVFAIDNKIYFMVKEENPAKFWSYDITTSTWIRLVNCYYPFSGNIGFSYQGFGFSGFGQLYGDNPTIYKYDPSKE
jgi:hypothetical protein